MSVSATCLPANELAWREAARANSAEAYEAFLLAHPLAPRAGEARRRLALVLRCSLLKQPGNSVARRRYLELRTLDLRHQDETLALARIQEPGPFLGVLLGMGVGKAVAGLLVSASPAGLASVLPVIEAGLPGALLGGLCSALLRGRGPSPGPACGGACGFLTALLAGWMLNCPDALPVALLGGLLGAVVGASVRASRACWLGGGLPACAVGALAHAGGPAILAHLGAGVVGATAGLVIALRVTGPYRRARKKMAAALRKLSAELGPLPHDAPLDRPTSRRRYLGG